MDKNISQNMPSNSNPSNPSQQLNFKKALEDYDKKYNTLVDYFCMVGANDEDLERAIQLAKEDKTTSFTP